MNLLLKIIIRTQILAAISFITILASYSYASSSNEQRQYYSTIEERNFPLHGNFCGRDIPTISAVIPAERAIALSQIPHTDNIDKLCKDHDICYAVNGVGSRVCDDGLSEAAGKLVKQIQDQDCKAFVNKMHRYFSLKSLKLTRKQSEEEHAWIMIPVTAISEFADATYMAYQVVASGVVDRFERSFPTVKRKFFPRLLPGRYKNCDQ